MMFNMTNIATKTLFDQTRTLMRTVKYVQICKTRITRLGEFYLPHVLCFLGLHEK